MLDNIILGRYIQGDSLLHRLDPRAKLVGCFFLLMIILMANNVLTYSILIVFLLILISLSKLSLRFFINGIKPMIWIICFTGFFQMLFTSGGTVYFQWSFLNITSYGIINAFYIMLRFLLIIMASTLLSLTTDPLNLAGALESLMKPLNKIGVPVHELAIILSMALRFVPTILDETQKIINAQRSRGVDFDNGNLLTRMKAMLPILIPLFASELRRADELANAMEARGYRGGSGRTKYRQLNWSMKDTTSFLVLAILAISIFFLKSA